ncbi:hypothetical protein FOA52_011547 [Chlamydomonas sp. UWO 241]|nr:hypothetical protein FOA52_011547 [Chlamydomonas sp. UWO 241]
MQPMQSSMQHAPRGAVWLLHQRVRCMSTASSPVTEQLRGLRAAMRLPPNPFKYKPRRVLGPKEVLYRGRGMLLIRFLVRMKVFQLAGAFTAAACLSLALGDGEPRSIAAAAAVATGCVVTSYCVWFYSGRYVGELSLALPDKTHLVFSVLDFWGSRQDDLVPLAQLDAPFANRSVGEVKAMAMVGHVLMPMRVRGGQDYYISLGHGYLLDKPALLNVMYGRPPGEAGRYVEGGASASERAAFEEMDAWKARQEEEGQPPGQRQPEQAWPEGVTRGGEPAEGAAAAKQPER